MVHLAWSVVGASHIKLISKGPLSAVEASRYIEVLGISISRGQWSAVVEAAYSISSISRGHRSTVEAVCMNLISKAHCSAVATGHCSTNFIYLGHSSRDIY